MATWTPESHQKTVLGVHNNAGQVLATHPQAIPPLGYADHQVKAIHASRDHSYTRRGNGSAWIQLNYHGDTLAPRLSTPNTAAWDHPQASTSHLRSNTQNVPHVHPLSDSPPVFHAPFPARLWDDGDGPPHFRLQVDNHQFSTPDNGSPMYPIQTPSIRTNTRAPLIDHSSSTNSNVEICQQGPPHFNANAPQMFGSSTSVSIGIESPQMHLDNIIPTDTQSSLPTHLQPHLPREPPPSEARRYRPGKEPAAEFEPNPLKLRESCERDGGNAFAVDWTLVAFHYGVTKEALVRSLDRGEIGRMKLKFPGGFEPRQAYDGFISKIGDRYECGLCKEGKRACWKNKKDAPRHLRKFHFGLGDPCSIWCVP